MIAALLVPLWPYLMPAAYVGGGLLLGAILWPIARSLLPVIWFGRWQELPQTREEHRYSGRDRHGPLLDARTRDERRGFALHHRQYRLKALAKAAAKLAAGAAACLYFYYHRRPLFLTESLYLWPAGVWATYFMAWPLALWAVWHGTGGVLKHGGKELLYLAAYQRVPWARVIDPPARPALSPVFNGMPWGDARPAPLQDVLSAYGGQGHEPQTRYRE